MPNKLLHVCIKLLFEAPGCCEGVDHLRTQTPCKVHAVCKERDRIWAPKVHVG